jgi:hypothetical protein
MPGCPSCNTHAAAITAAQTSSIVRDLGVTGAISLAAGSLLWLQPRRVARPAAAPKRRPTPDGHAGSAGFASGGPE